MASGVVGLAGAAGAFTAVPYVGWAVGLAAAYVDQTIVYPALSGSPDEATQPQLANLPMSEQGVGAPRTFAIGARMRTPAHVLFQTEKARETMAGGGKGGTSVSVMRVYVDALIHLNDRPTKRLLQLIGNGQLILHNERDMLGITTENMTAVVDGSNVKFELGSPLDGDFETVFQPYDLIYVRGMVRVSGTQTFNGTYLQVVSIAPPVSPSGATMIAQPVDGQNLSSLSYTGGTPFSPSKIIRSDSSSGGTELQIFEGENVNFRIRILGTGGYPPGYTMLARNPGEVFQPGDIVRVRNTERWGASGALCLITSNHLDGVLGNMGLRILDYANVGAPFNQWDGDGAEPPNFIHWGVYDDGQSGWTANPFGPNTPFIVEHAANSSHAPEVFPEDFDAVANFSSGNEDQGQPPVLITALGANNSSNYRGMAVQGLDECYVSVFGDQLPTNLEAIIDVDDEMTWAQAVEALMQRGGLLNTQIDTARVPGRLFRGASFRGTSPVMQQIQPVLIAGQLLCQDSGGVLSMFAIDNADSVQIENGATFSDFGARMYGEQAEHDKVQSTDAAESDMPTSVGIKFQDPDQYFTTGFEHFGLRNPSGVDHTNERIVNLTSMVLTRRDARDLGTTIMRRAWVNRRTYRMALPCAYLHLLENDLITWTDDDGEVITARIIQRDIGANFLVNVTALREMTDLAVVGSPVQSSTEVIPQNVTATTVLKVTAIDAPAISNSHTQTPGVRLAVADMGGTLQTATVWESQNGNSYQPVGTVGGTCALAYFLSTLSAQTASEVYGTTTVTLRAQTVDTYFAQTGSETLEACTQAQAEAGKNWCAIIDNATAEVEIAAFTTVSVSAGGIHTLGGWLRGLRGTPSGAHTQGATLVLLNQSSAGIFWREFAGPTPTTLAYKVVPSGGDIATTEAVTISSPPFRNVLPLPLREVTRTYNATTLSTRFNVTEHWERTVLPLGTQPPHTLDEPFEGYRIYIYDSGSSTDVADSYILDSRATGSSTLRDTYFDWPNARATAAGYTPGASTTYNVAYQQIGRWGYGPLRAGTI